MRKKVIDIFFPKELEKKENKTAEKKKELERSKREPGTFKERPEFQSPFWSHPKKILISGMGALTLAFILCFFTLAEASIKIWPEADIISLKTNLTVDKTFSKVNLQDKTIPGEVFEREKTITENFPASGKVLKEGKAEGIIRIYNNYSTLSQIFVADTRFVSSDGKMFRTPVKVMIPGGRQEKGKFTPGEIDIKVVADEAGPEYNIGPSVFSIPGLAGTEKYTKFYGKSFEEFKGGFSQEFSQVTKEDLENAKEILTKAAKEQCETALKNELQSEKISSEFMFLEKAVQTEIIETFSLARAGDAAENFNYQAKALSKTLIFSKEKIENFSKEFILSQITEGKKLYEESLKIDFSPKTINSDVNKIVLSLEISAKIYSDIDMSNFKNILQGKSETETKVFLKNQPEIIKAEVELWPFWVRKIPKNPEKIKLELKIDASI